jgi:molybdopterin-biosynthesis enzyme MoeA-like protein
LAGIKLPAQDDSTKEKVASFAGKLVLYKSEWRSNIIKFCGWLDQVSLAKRKEQKKQLSEICGQIITRESEI